MKKTCGLAVLGAILGLASCSSSAEEHGSYVVLDHEAREAGFTLEGAEPEQVLPKEARSGVELAIVGPTGRTIIKLEADQVVVVHGAHGDVDKKTLVREVDPDAVIVKGSDAAVRELAAVLGGKITVLAGGASKVTATNAFAETSRIRVPDGLTELVPVFADRPATSRGAAQAAAFPASPAIPAIPGANALAPLAAITATHATTPAEQQPAELAWDALLPPAITCADPVAGTWVSNHYHANLDEWYVFTMTVAKPAPGSHALAGHIRAEFWEGGARDTKPPACGKDTTHGAVEMPARGRIDGTSFTLSGVSFKKDASLCKGRDYSYALDNFTATLDDGANLHTANNDGSRSIDDATHFRRVSCR